MPDNQWHLDKRVPIALIVTLILTSASGIWFVAEINSRLSYIERSIAQSQSDSGQIIQIKEQLRGIERIVQRLEQYFDRRSEKTDRQYPGVQ